MTQKYWSQKPTSFADTVKLTKSYVKTEIVRETQQKQLYYHNLAHAIAVERRAKSIFQAIKVVLAQDNSPQQLARMESIISICGLAHDMVQIFEPTPANQTRKRRSGDSETETANKLIKYIHHLNQAIAAENLDPSLQFSDREQEMMREAIVATVCVPDPLGKPVESAFSSLSIYQPYFYDAQPKTSIIGHIIALADLGALGIDGVEVYIHDGVLIFLEDNPYLQQLILNQEHPTQPQDFYSYSQEEIKAKFLTMTRFIIDFANERQARFAREIIYFPPQIRQILRDRVFIYLNRVSLERLQNMVPSQETTCFSELANFFRPSEIDRQLVNRRSSRQTKN